MGFMFIFVTSWAMGQTGTAEAPSAPPTPTISPSTQPSVSAAQQSAASGEGTAPRQLGKVVVTSDLDIAREQIAPSLGATTYNITPAQIQSIPGGENASFKEVLLRAPGVVEDSFGQEHVRGEHANLTYRVNGVLLPEPVSGFGQELDTRLIDNLTLITGALPAQFGFHTAGIVDVTTKSGDTLNHNELSLYGGSNDTIQPSLQVGGTSGRLDYFITTSYNHNGIGIENPTGTHHPSHDYTDQERGFGYFSYRIDDTSRVSLLANASYADFQIPTSAGVAPAFNLNGVTTANSSKVDENQNEQEYYTVVSYQKTTGEASLQLSAFSRYGQITFSPDPTRDLIFQGVSSAVYNNFATTGLQFDGSYIVNDQHTLRTGFITDFTEERLDSVTGVFQVDNAGAQASIAPTDIYENTSNRAWESGIYLQDEWRLTQKLTLNYGLRYDRFDSNFDTEDQVSPRANLVYKIDDATTAHIGYSRYFVPPPIQNVDIASVQRFNGTTNAAGVQLADPPKVERSNYFDAGISHQFTPAFQMTLDGFYKQSHNLVDLGQFGAAIIETPFNYRTGKVYGGELSGTYRQGGFSAFANFSYVETAAHNIDSQEFQIDPDEFAYIKTHDIHLDHEAELSGAFGVAYQWKNDRVYLDLLAASGLRSGFANTESLGSHYPVNVGYEHIFRPNGPNGNPLRFRCDIVNIFDEKYELRDGSGIGVGAPNTARESAFSPGWLMNSDGGAY